MANNTRIWGFSIALEIGTIRRSVNDVVYELAGANKNDAMVITGKASQRLSLAQKLCYEFMGELE